MFYSLLTALSWALTGIFIAYISEVNFIEITWIRATVALVILIPFSLKQINFNAKATSISLLMSLYYASATAAFTLAPVSCVALLIATSPLFTILLRMITKDRISNASKYGSIIGFLGIVIFFSNYLINRFDFSMKLLWGSLLACLAALLKATYSFVLFKSKRFKEESSRNLTIQTFLIISVLLLPSTNIDSFFTLSPISYLNILMLSVVATILPTLFNTMASKTVNATTHTSICLLTPLFASALADLFLQQYLHLIQVAGAFVTILGVLISTEKILLRRKR
ncbi:MAG: DMT family transporter [Gammaproteobacteria bacterium]